MFNQTNHPQSSVLFIGAAHLDRLGRMSHIGQLEKSNLGVFSESPGGAALNTASIFTALGGTALLHSILGDDSASQAVRRACEQRDINLSASRGEATATYTALLNPDGGLIIALADMVVYDQFEAINSAPEITDLTNQDWMFVDANLPSEELQKLSKIAPCSVAASAVSAAKCSRLRASLSNLDVLFCTRSEIETLLQLPPNSPDQGIALAAQSAGLKSLVVSDAENPVLCAQNGKSELIPVPPVKAIVDVTGAGDALAAGTLFALCAGNPLAHSVSLGIKAAQSVLAAKGPWLDDLTHLLTSKSKL